jgi:hypothetical protein
MIYLILWLLSAFVGSVFALLGIRDAILDWIAASDLHNGRRKIRMRLAKLGIARMIIKFTVSASWLILGLVSASAASPNYQPTNPAGVMILVLTNVAISLLVILDWVEHKRTTDDLMRLYNEREVDPPRYRRSAQRC